MVLEYLSKKLSPFEITNEKLIILLHINLKSIQVGLIGGLLIGSSIYFFRNLKKTYTPLSSPENSSIILRRKLSKSTSIKNKNARLLLSISKYIRYCIYISFCACNFQAIYYIFKSDTVKLKKFAFRIKNSNFQNRIDNFMIFGMLISILMPKYFDEITKFDKINLGGLLALLISAFLLKSYNFLKN